MVCWNRVAEKLPPKLGWKVVSASFPPFSYPFLRHFWENQLFPFGREHSLWETMVRNTSILLREFLFQIYRHFTEWGPKYLSYNSTILRGGEGFSCNKTQMKLKEKEIKKQFISENFNWFYFCFLILEHNKKDHLWPGHLIHVISESFQPLSIHRPCSYLYLNLIDEEN